MDIIKTLQQELNIRYSQAEAAVKLIDEGNTIPFIARYRKEATGSLNDEVLRALDERLRYLRSLEEKKEQVIGTIREQGKLTEELERQIREAATMVAVDDLSRQQGLGRPRTAAARAVRPRHQVKQARDSRPLKERPNLLQHIYSPAWIFT